MSQRVTVQDIADALNLSRTTVSKVLNHSPAVSEATRAMVLGKARELGYRVWSPAAAESSEKESAFDVNHFALVMHAVPGGNHMGTVIIPAIDQRLRQKGYSLVTCTITDEDFENMQLPPILSHIQTKAIICLEMFQPEYSKLLCSLEKPVLFIDANADFHQLNIDADLLLMESRSSVMQLLTSLIRRHKVTTMGFVGDAGHCLSFRERYEAFQLTALQERIQTQAYSILAEDSRFGDIHWVKEQLEAMEHLPDLFFCANDYLAALVMQSLEILGKRVPEDVMVCGFDGIPSISWPLNQLTTVVTPTSQLGTFAASILLRRLSLTETSGSITYLKTGLLFRESAP